MLPDMLPQDNWSCRVWGVRPMDVHPNASSIEALELLKFESLLKAKGANQPARRGLGLLTLKPGGANVSEPESKRRQPTGTARLRPLDVETRRCQRQLVTGSFVRPLSLRLVHQRCINYGHLSSSPPYGDYASHTLPRAALSRTT
jgi:hypothetical protein